MPVCHAVSNWTATKQERREEASYFLFILSFFLLRRELHLSRTTSISTFPRLAYCVRRWSGTPMYCRGWRGVSIMSTQSPSADRLYFSLSAERPLNQASPLSLTSMQSVQSSTSLVNHSLYLRLTTLLKLWQYTYRIYHRGLKHLKNEESCSHGWLRFLKACSLSVFHSLVDGKWCDWPLII